MNDIVDASQSSTRELQEQIDIYKEKNRRELTELQRLLKERGQELEKYLLATKTLQEEVHLSMPASSNVIGADLSADTAPMAGVVKSRPSLVSQTEASHAEQQMMSHCSNSTSLTPSLQHLFLQREMSSLWYFQLPAAHSNPKHYIQVKSLSWVWTKENLCSLLKLMFMLRGKIKM